MLRQGNYGEGGVKISSIANTVFFFNSLMVGTHLFDPAEWTEVAATGTPNIIY